MLSAAGADNIYEPERIVGERKKSLGGGKTETQYEVKWKGYDAKQNTCRRPAARGTRDAGASLWVVAAVGSCRYLVVEQPDNW